MPGSSVFSQKLGDYYSPHKLSFSNSTKSIVSPLSNFTIHYYYSNPRLLLSIHRPIRFKVHASVADPNHPKWWEINAGPNMIDIHSTQEFLGALSQAQDRLVVVEFYGTWCASCKALFPKLCKIAEEHPEILFLKVNFDENKSLCKRLNVKVLPYFHFYRGAQGLLQSFPCSLAKFQKLKDAIATHNISCDGLHGSCSPKDNGGINIPGISPASDDSSAESSSR